MPRTQDFTIFLLATNNDRQQTKSIAISLVHTIFIRIVVATATTNFSLAWVRLLIEGGSYSRVAFINFGPGT